MNKLKSSSTYLIYTSVKNKIQNNSLYLFLTDFSFISSLWYRSFIYARIRKIFYGYAKTLYSRGFTLPASIYIYLTLPAVLLPHSIVLTLFIQLLAIVYAPTFEQSFDFFIYSIFCGLLLIVTGIIVSDSSFYTVTHIVTSFTLYFLMSKLINSKKSLYATLKAIFIFNTILCAVNISSYILTGHFINNSSAICNIIILTTPISTAFLFRLSSMLQRYIYSTLSLLLTFTVIMITSNISAIIAYTICIVLFTAFSKPKYLFTIFLIFPGVVLFSINRFLSMWSGNSSGIKGILYTAINFWRNGLGFGTDEFLELYNRNIYQNTPIVAGRPFLHLGRILLFITLWYNLKTVRSAIFIITKASPTNRFVLLAILSSVIGFSVFGLIDMGIRDLNSTLFYWIILGILSASLKLSDKN